MTRIETVSPAELSNSLLDEIRRFRGRVYGEVPAVIDGRDVHASDVDAWHVILRRDGAIAGCARYRRGPVVELGGFVVGRRGTRDTVSVINGVIKLANRLGDVRFYAHASPISSSVLRKLGGRVIDSRYDSVYQGVAEIIEINLQGKSGSIQSWEPAGNKGIRLSVA